MEKNALKYQTAWRRLGDAVVKPDGNYANSVCMNPNVIQKDNDIYLFYAGDQVDHYRNIRLVIFKDGDFSKPDFKGIVINNGPWGSFDGKWCVLPNVVKFKDKWHMYYSGNCGFGEGLSTFPGLGLAFSDDLIHWEKYSDNPVIKPEGIDGAPDAIGIAGGGLIAMPDGKLRWYYTGCPTIGAEHFLDQQKSLCYAESSDGINWEKKGAFISRDIDRNYKDIACTGGPTLFEDGIFKLWHSCIGTRWGFYSIGYSESEDGINWNVGECYGDELAFGPRTRHLDMSEPYLMWDNQMVEYPAVFNINGKKYMFYTGNGYGLGGIGIAQACNIRVYARNTELFATYGGEKYDVTITAKVNGVEIPASEWSKPDSDCNVWREAEIGGVNVRLIVTHVIDGIRVFCTAISNGEPVRIETEVSIGSLASKADEIYIEANESKSLKVDVIL